MQVSAQHALQQEQSIHFNVMNVKAIVKHVPIQLLAQFAQPDIIITLEVVLIAH